MFRTHLHALGRRLAALPRSAALAGATLFLSAAGVPGQEPSFTATTPPSVVHRVEAANDRLELIVNSSRILTLDTKIPQAQVGNEEIIELTPLAANRVQIFAKKTGVTQINLWDEQGEIHSIDVVVVGDARELEILLGAQFPNCVLRVTPTATAVIVSGQVDDPQNIDRIVAIAEDYYPKVVNNMTVADVQQVLLQCKVMEVSRTKLRRLGFDWANFNSDDFVTSGVSGLISNVSSSAGTIATSGGETLAFGIVESGNAFFGVLDALEQRRLAKIISEPTIVAYNGRAARFLVGGSFPILVPQSLGTVSIQYRDYGTELDFVPFVLGNGHIRLEVRPRVSEIDTARSVTINDTEVPGLLVREVDTGVEMQAGQTFALAGLVQDRVEATSRGFPVLSNIPIVGAAFGTRSEQRNEVELLILVTPQLAEPLDEHEVPPCGPGENSRSPTDYELYGRGFLEVPVCCPNGQCGRCEHCRGAHGGLPPEGEPVEVIRIEPSGEPIETPEAAVPAEARAPARRARQPAEAQAGAPAPRRQAGQRLAPAASAEAPAQPASVSLPPSARRRAQPPRTVQRPPAGGAPGFIGDTGYDPMN